MLGYSPFMPLPITFWATILCQVMPLALGGCHCDEKGGVTDWWGTDMAPSKHRTRWNKVSTHSMSTRMQRPHPPLPPGLGSSLCLFSSSPGLGLLGTPLALQPPDTHLPLTHHPCPPQGYSFVAPSILFDHNNAVMTDVLEVPGAGDRPGRAAVARSAMMQVGWARVGRS